MILETLTSPIILFFALGLLAAFARSDLVIPEALAKGMSIYLMAAIGLKGGVSVAAAGFGPDLLIAALAGVLLSFAIPFLAYALLRSIGRLDGINAAAVAAHYGSVSLVTFVTADQLLTASGISAAGYMVAVLALMETPAIISGLLLARRGTKQSADSGASNMWHEVFLNGSVVLLTGSFLIGLIAGKDGFAPIAPMFEVGYKGVLCLFLLDMGLIAARRIMASKGLTFRLIALAIAMPIGNGLIALGLAAALGMAMPEMIVLAILAASASYIAVPAAMRLALPEADPGIYLSMSLGITFPFNVIFGISLFTFLARMIS